MESVCEIKMVTLNDKSIELSKGSKSSLHGAIMFVTSFRDHCRVKRYALDIPSRIWNSQIFHASVSPTIRDPQIGLESALVEYFACFCSLGPLLG
jgi:hypothetical protein